MNEHIFGSVEEAVRTLKLDRRRKWENHMGQLVYPMWYTAPCYESPSGKRREVVPIPAMAPNGELVKIIDLNNQK